MPEDVTITIQPDQDAIDKTWDDHIPLGLVTSLYHLLQSKGVITTEEMQTIVDGQLAKFSQDMAEYFTDQPDEGKRHLERVTGYLENFMSRYKA